MGTHIGRIIKGKSGQNIIEYALLAAIIAAAAISMSVYVFRSIQSTQQEIQKTSQL